MSKNFKNIISLVLTFLVLFTSNTNLSFARSRNKDNTNQAKEETSLGLEVKMDGSKTDAPLSLKQDKESFFFAKNISPGDELKSEIVFKNTEKVTVQVSILEISDRSAFKGDLGDEIKLEVILGKDKIYSGPYSKVTTPITNWIPIKPGEELPLKIYMNVPDELDNRFQGAKINGVWSFGVRSNILSGVKANISYIDENGNVIKTEEKEFDYDHLVTIDDLTPPNGYGLTKFDPVKVTKNGDNVKVNVKKIGNTIKVKINYTDKDGNIIKTDEKEFPYNHELREKDLNLPNGYKINSFKLIKLTKDGEIINILVEKINNNSSNNSNNTSDILNKKEKVKTDDAKSVPKGILFLLGAVIISACLLFSLKKTNKQNNKK